MNAELPGRAFKISPNEKHKTHLWYYIVGIIVCISYLLPFYVLINMSLRDITDVSSRLFLPDVIKLDNYKSALAGSDLWRGFRNSLVLALETVVIEISIGSIGAYGLARLKNRYSASFRTLNMMVMMIPGTALLVGTYSLMNNLGLSNSLIGLALLSAGGGLPGTVFFYTNFVAAIPAALDEAAEIDGASVLRTFVQIIFPQLKAITVTRIIMIFIGSWNDYLMPMYLLSSNEKQTIILVIKQAFSSSNGTGNLPLAAATCALGLLPIILLYLLMQKHIIQSQIDSSIK